MARRLPPTDLTENNPHAGGGSGLILKPTQGGASGIIENAETRIHYAGEATSSARQVEPNPEAPPPPVPRRWRVTQDRPVVLDGARTYMRAGKEVDDLNYNVDQLRQQGVPMEEIL